MAEGIYNIIMHPVESIQDIVDQVKNSLKSMGDSMKKVFDTIKEMVQGKDEIDSAPKEEEKTTEEEVNTDEEKIEEGEEEKAESEGDESDADTDTEIDEDDNSEKEKEAEEEKKRNVTKLSIEAETGCKDGDVECYIKHSNNLNFNYVLNEEGNIIVPPISCLDNMNECICVGRNEKLTDPKKILDKYGEKLGIKLDENGNMVIQKSIAYLSNYGKFDVASIGSFQWAAKDGKNGGGLADLLDAAKTGYESFYKDYIAIMGENGNKANINNSDIANNPEKMNLLIQLSEKYAAYSDFRKFEQDVAYNIYYEKAVSRLPKETQNRINNLPDEGKQIIMSTFVQFGQNSSVVKDEFKKTNNDYEALKNIVDTKDGISSARYNTELNALKKMVNNK